MDGSGEKLKTFTRMMKHDALRIPDRLNGIADSIMEARKMADRELIRSSVRSVSLIVHCLVEDIDNEPLWVRDDLGIRAENDTLRLVLERADRWLERTANYLDVIYQHGRASEARSLASILRMARDVLLSNKDRPITPLPKREELQESDKC